MTCVKVSNDRIKEINLTIQARGPSLSISAGKVADHWNAGNDIFFLADKRIDKEQFDRIAKSVLADFGYTAKLDRYWNFVIIKYFKYSLHQTSDGSTKLSESRIFVNFEG